VKWESAEVSEGGAVVAEALSGHMTEPEISVLREAVIMLGVRVRVVEDSLRSVRRNAPSRPPEPESAVDQAARHGRLYWPLPTGGLRSSGHFTVAFAPSQMSMEVTP
jgi:hypothetical protein